MERTTEPIEHFQKTYFTYSLPHTLAEFFKSCFVHLKLSFQAPILKMNSLLETYGIQNSQISKYLKVICTRIVCKREFTFAFKRLCEGYRYTCDLLGKK